MKFPSARIFLFASLLLLSVSSWAQEGSIYITVLDQITMRKAAGVEVRLFSGTGEEGSFGQLLQEGKTNEKGRFYIEADTARIKTIALTAQGYEAQNFSFDRARTMGFQLFLELRNYETDEVVFTANKFQEKKTDIPVRIDVIEAREIAFRNPQTSADLLEQEGSVFVQRSQMGGGSPNLRGFEANKVLLVIDGIRMNNAIYRSGHLQNVITIAPGMLERSEVQFGPGSVIYGSDALGGVMHFYTRQPRLSSTDRPLVTVDAMARYASVNQGLNGEVDFNLGFRRWGLLTSFAISDYGDLRVGNWRRDVYPAGFGTRPEYVTRIEGRDTLVNNPDPNVMVPTGYTQYDFLQKFYFLQSDRVSHTLNFQYSTSTDIPRFDRLTQERNGRLRFAEWYYGPQERLMVAYQPRFFGGERAFYDQLQISTAFQQVRESRHTRSFGEDVRSDRKETVRIVSLNADATKLLPGNNELAFGLEAVYNLVGSEGTGVNIETGETGPIDSRYPDGGTLTRSLAAYFTHRWEASRSVIFTYGVRYTHYLLNATFEDKTFFPFPYDEINQQNGAVSGNVGLVLKPRSDLRFSFGIATGFRAPNLDDVAKVFDSRPGTVVVPNPDLQPEYTYNGETTINWSPQPWFQLELTGFYTYYDNAIVIRDFSFGNQDSIVYDGVLSKVQANVNASQAWLAGGSAGITGKAGPIRYRAQATYTYGQETGSDVPLDHIAPLFGRVELTWEARRWQLTGALHFNGRKDTARYSPAELDDLPFATPSGMPGWWTVNLKASYALNQILQLQGGIENIFDQHYRAFSSRISGPGRNFYLTLRASF